MTGLCRTDSYMRKLNLYNACKKKGEGRCDKSREAAVKAGEQYLKCRADQAKKDKSGYNDYEGHLNYYEKQKKIDINAPMTQAAFRLVVEEKNQERQAEFEAEKKFLEGILKKIETPLKQIEWLTNRINDSRGKQITRKAAEELLSELNKEITQTLKISQRVRR